MRKIILTGVKPTGTPQLGNYLGALKYLVRLQKEMADYEMVVFIADLHAITIPIDSKVLHQNIRSLAALYIACGLDPDKLTMFIQSEVEEHAQMGYIMQAISYMGEMERMTQYKDKVSKGVVNITTSLFTYPALMAADILLYDAKYIPVGDDQKQHLELARNLAQRFNNKYGETFVVPEGLTVKVGARIMDLQEPNKKMSKSDVDKGCIVLTESLDVIKKKIKSAVTDSEAKVYYDPANKPGISNLMTIYSAITNKSFKEIEEMYVGHGYGDFKNDLSNIVVEELRPVQEKYFELLNSSKLDEILDKGKNKAKEMAQGKLIEVYKKIGLGR